ncbi:MAG: hypothetical protein N2V77_01270 [Canidatus Methanoxibalbensis ujae]|nr:hypothetical protein [Candidatus Methanoxibalbensis ujae]
MLKIAKKTIVKGSVFTSVIRPLDFSECLRMKQTENETDTPAILWKLEALGFKQFAGEGTRFNSSFQRRRTI